MELLTTVTVTISGIANTIYMVCNTIWMTLITTLGISGTFFTLAIFCFGLIFVFNQCKKWFYCKKAKE